MDSLVGFDFGVPSTGLCHCSAINSQIKAEVESLKKGMEASIPRLEEALGKLQSFISSIPALVKQEMKEELAVIPSLAEEAVKTQFRASIPELIQALTVMKEVQRITTPQVEEASTVAPPFLPSAPSLPRPIITRASPQLDESSYLHLKFAGNLPESKSLFTKEDIKDQGASLKVELHDQFGHKVDVGPESSAKIKIFVVEGDFNIEDSDGDISQHVVTPREGKPPLLKGISEISLFKGVASVSEIAFTDNSTPMRNGKFKLGAEVIKGVSPGVSIKGAVSDAFQVKEHRNTFNRKQQISLDDEVWHLINIGKGKTHKKLEDKGIRLVKDLLDLYNNDRSKLLQIFPGGKKKLNQTIEQAKSCARSALPIQSQMIPDNSPKEVVETPYEKQSDQTHIPPVTNLTAVETEPFCSTTVNSAMPFNTIDAYQGEPAMQPYGFTHNSLRELGPQIPLYTAFENQKELSEFCDALSGILTQAENVHLPTSASNIHLNATGADQEFHQRDLVVDDYNYEEGYIELRYTSRWHVVRAILRGKEGPRAGKRQKLS